MQDEIKELEKPISNFSFFLSLGAWRTRGLTPYIWSYLEKPFFLKIILRLTDLERLKIFSTEISCSLFIFRYIVGKECLVHLNQGANRYCNIYDPYSSLLLHET